MVSRRHHLSAACQVLLRQQQRRHRRFRRPDSKSSTICRISASTAIWLLPFYPSPRRDDGYDIADYRDIHPDYGTLRGFPGASCAPRMRAAFAVITELVINHTSDQHPWFQRARAAKPGSAARNFYVWANDDQKYKARPRSSSSTPRNRTGPGTRPPRPYLLAPLLLAPAGSQFRQSARARGDARRDALLARHRRRRPAARRRPLSGRARRHQHTKTCPRPTRSSSRCAPAVDAGYPDRMLLAEANQWPEDARGLFRRRRRMPHGVPLPADAAHVHGDRAGGPLPDHRHHAADAGYPGQLPMGDLPAQPRRADARDGHRPGARLSVVTSMPPTGARGSTSASAAAWRRCWKTTAARSS